MYFYIKMFLLLNEISDLNRKIKKKPIEQLTFLLKILFYLFTYNEKENTKIFKNHITKCDGIYYSIAIIIFVLLQRM